MTFRRHFGYENRHDSDGDRWQKRENNSDKRVNYCYIQTPKKAAENSLPEQQPVEANLPF